MLLNLGSGGHLRFPCYLCNIERKTNTDTNFGVKTSYQHQKFYDIEFFKNQELRNVACNITNGLGNLPDNLQDIFESRDFEHFVCPGSLHTLLGLNALFDHISKHDRWIPNLYARLGESTVTQSEMDIIHQERYIASQNYSYLMWRFKCILKSKNF